MVRSCRLQKFQQNLNLPVKPHDIDNFILHYLGMSSFLENAILKICTTFSSGVVAVQKKAEKIRALVVYSKFVNFQKSVKVGLL